MLKTQNKKSILIVQTFCLFLYLVPTILTQSNLIDIENSRTSTPIITTLEARKTTHRHSSTQLKSDQEQDSILTFEIKSNPLNKAPCLRARFSLFFDISYQALYLNSTRVQTARINVTDVTYHGTCQKEFNSIYITFLRDWQLVLNYTLKGDDVYSLSKIVLKYTIDNSLFPNVTLNELGRHTAESADLNEFRVSVGKSYKCYAKTRIDLKDNVTVELRNYQAQAFIKEDSDNTGFDTAVECLADIVHTNKLIPIIVGGVLALLIVLVLVAYVIGRRRYRPTYQQV